jgi:hypothetical protein
MKTTLTLISGAAMLAVSALSLNAQTPYTVAYTAGGSWNTVFAQGFSTSLGASPVPGAVNGDPVTLSQFQFFKSGNADTAANIQLAIFNTMYPNLAGLTTGSPSFVGLSANTIASTAPLAVGDAITFNFNNLPLVYGSDYSAVFVNVSGINITPVRVSALTANYQDLGGGDFHPVPNYGGDNDFAHTTSNFIVGNFFNAFSYGGDANFSASLTTVPEPQVCALLGLGSLLLIRRVRSRLC